MAEEPDRIRNEIEATRSDLARNVDGVSSRRRIVVGRGARCGRSGPRHDDGRDRVGEDGCCCDESPRPPREARDPARHMTIVAACRLAHSVAGRGPEGHIPVAGHDAAKHLPS